MKQEIDYRFTIMKPAPLARWELAALTDEEGRVDRPLADPRLVQRPRVDLDGDRLVWVMISGDNFGREVPCPRDLLTHFVRLWKLPAGELLAFARSYGVLQICEHELPSSHAVGCHARSEPDAGAVRYYESVATWRHFSRQAFSVLNVASRLHLGEPGPPEDWEAIFERSGRPGPAPWWQQSADSVPFEQFMLAESCVVPWLAIGNVHIAFSWIQPAPTMTLQGAGLFGALAAQLALAVGRSEGLAVCRACGAPYAPRRRPTPSRRNYCSACGLKAASRDANRDYRRKRRGRDHV